MNYRVNNRSLGSICRLGGGAHPLQWFQESHSGSGYTRSFSDLNRSYSDAFDSISQCWSLESMGLIYK